MVTCLGRFGGLAVELLVEGGRLSRARRLAPEVGAKQRGDRSAQRTGLRPRTGRGRQGSGGSGHVLRLRWTGAGLRVAQRVIADQVGAATAGPFGGGQGRPWCS
jgi:hypothetical protein